MVTGLLFSSSLVSVCGEHDLDKAVCAHCSHLIHSLLTQNKAPDEGLACFAAGHLPPPPILFLHACGSFSNQSLLSCLWVSLGYDIL